MPAMAGLPDHNFINTPCNGLRFSLWIRFENNRESRSPVAIPTDRHGLGGFGIITSLQYVGALKEESGRGRRRGRRPIPPPAIMAAALTSVHNNFFTGFQIDPREGET